MSQDRNDKPEQTPTKAEQTKPLAYAKPAVRRLGSVRDLTLALRAGALGDGGGMMAM
jgi:hypothetical protein